MRKDIAVFIYVVVRIVSREQPRNGPEIEDDEITTSANF